MKKTKFSHKVMAVFLTLTFLPSLLPVNMLLASNNGPNAPEAASFEPVDATDMVNLATGDLSYVLPLMNVPSPEGGYPIALSYHSGISMDQEASWVGLGWNINPGAINRSVNGYPDDWKEGRFKEYYYDQSDKGQTYTFASIGYTGFSTGLNSVGLSVSHSDSRGFGGSVSFGYNFGGGSLGASLGTNGASVNGGVGVADIGNSSIGIGGSIGTNGIGLSSSFSWDKRIGGDGVYFNKGLSLGLNSSWSGDVSVNAAYSAGERGKKNSIGINFSSQGISATGKIMGVGTGANFAFEQALKQSDYNLEKSGWFIPLFIPTGDGVLTASFGQQKIRYSVDETKNNAVSGTLHFNDAESESGNFVCRYKVAGIWQKHFVPGYSHQHSGTTDYEVNYVKSFNAFTDIYEVDFNSNSQALDLDNNNATFPNYDNYRVTAQGLSGNMVPRVYENAALLGLSKEIEADNGGEDYELNYSIPNNNMVNFNVEPEFHFENEFSSSLFVGQATFNPSVSPSSIFGYLNGISTIQAERKRGGRYVKYYTNNELSTSTPFNAGLLKANAQIDYSNSTQFEPDGIGAYMVTTADGKTYHYALPVYNHEIISRQFGIGINSTNEDDAFFEKRQLQRYATHWLLTAVTGPDFVDTNGNNIADEGDYGYWVTMDYGKWTDSYIWYAPHGKDYNEEPSNPDIKSYTWGRKEIYYLDKVHTRSHTALFVKEERNDAQGKYQFYKHRKDKNNMRVLGFNPQSLLRLKEIILLKNDDATTISKVNNSNMVVTPSPNYTKTVEFYDFAYEGGGTKTIKFSQQNNILDDRDVTNWNSVRSNALKVIDFGAGYSYELASGAPYTYGGVNGRLTLKNVTFKGKGGQQVLPPYKFEYNQGSYNINHVDQWGYNKYSPDLWSLREITMPTGGKIRIDYEPDSFVSAIDQDFSINAENFPDTQNNIYINHPNSESFLEYGINNNSKLPVTYLKLLNCHTEYFDQYGDPISNPQTYYDYESYYGQATVTQILNGGSRLKLQFDQQPTLHEDVFAFDQSCSELTNGYPNTIKVDINFDELTTGLRVANIVTTDGTVEYKTEYDYNIPNTSNTSGVVSYIPFVNQFTNEIPYGIELPPPVPMYGHVKMTSYGDNGVSLGHTRYEFKTITPKNNNNSSIGFPGVISATKTQNDFFVDSNNDKVVDIESIVIEDNMASLGQMISVSNYNSQGQLLSRTTNNYEGMGEVSQGVAQESFQTYKEVDYKSSSVTDKWVINSSTKKIYPSSLKSTTVTQGGFTSTTYFDSYDGVSGQLLETRTIGSDGTAFKTEVVPAYAKYPVLGSKADNTNNKNMLVQEAMTKAYIDQSGTWKETGAGITTWNPETYSYTVNSVTYLKDVWRKHKTYVWDGPTNTDGIFTDFTGEDDGFNWSTSASSQPNDWKLVSQISKYDKYSMPLEVIDINQNRASTKMGDDDTKTIAVGNAAYDEMHYSGAEYIKGSNFDGGIYGVGRNSERAHTGAYSIKITSQQGFRKYVNGHGSGKYKISVWASKDNHANARVNDGSGLKQFNGEKIIAGDWVLLNHYVDWNSASKTVYVTSSSGTTYFDDFRIHPVESSMTSYVYNDWGELEAILGNNNMATTFEYDEIGRLIRSKSEVADDTGLIGGLKTVVETEYENSQTLASTIDPLTVSVTYGSSSSNHQQFVSTVSGGSGQYTFRWYKGIGSSSSNFESTWSGSASSFTWNNISGCDTHWVKLVVTDNNYGYLGEATRIIRNNNECDPGSGGGNQQ